MELHISLLIIGNDGEGNSLGRGGGRSLKEGAVSSHLLPISLDNRPFVAHFFQEQLLSNSPPPPMLCVCTNIVCILQAPPPQPNASEKVVLRKDWI